MLRLAVVLAEVIQAFSAPENAVRMDEARDNACNDMGKMLQFVLPVATQIQQEVIKAYGFSCDGEGGSHMEWRWDELGVGLMISGPRVDLFVATGRQSHQTLVLRAQGLSSASPPPPILLSTDS